MSKPWDAIRVKVVNPFGSGEFAMQPDGPRVRLTWIGSGACNIAFGAGCDCRYTAKGLRQLIEFISELADQMESQ